MVSQASFKRRVALLKIPRVKLRGVRDKRPWASSEIRSMWKMTGTSISFFSLSHFALIHESLHQLPWWSSDTTVTSGLFSQLQGSLMFGRDKLHSRIKFAFESKLSNAFSKGRTNTCTGRRSGSQLIGSGLKPSGDFPWLCINSWRSFKIEVWSREWFLEAKSNPGRCWLLMAQSKMGLKKLRGQRRVLSKWHNSTSAVRLLLNAPNDDGRLPTTDTPQPAGWLKFCSSCKMTSSCSSPLLSSSSGCTWNWRTELDVSLVDHMLDEQAEVCSLLLFAG